MQERLYVVLHMGKGPLFNLNDPEIVPVGNSNKFYLTDDIWIERLDSDLGSLIAKACQPPHHRIDNGAIDRHLYAFVRRQPENETSRFSGMQELLAAVALSRLIHPTSTGQRYCAWVNWVGDGEPYIQAIQFTGIGSDVILGERAKDWLNERQAAELRDLLKGWIGLNNTMPKRIHHAYWTHEFLMRLSVTDMRWMLAVSAIEALVNTKTSGNKNQFVDRGFYLAEKFDIDLSREDLKKAYDVRSKLVHAENFLVALDGFVPVVHQNLLCERLESLLRMTLKNCFLDRAFGEIFNDPTTIEKTLRA